MSDRRVRAWWLAAALCAFVLIVDQVAKSIVEHDIVLGEQVNVLGPLKLTLSHNEGVAFGLANGGGIGLIVITLIALGVVLWLFSRDPTRPGMWVATGLLAGGASPEEIRHAFLVAITNHFLGYGHPMIYCQKAFELLDRIGWSEADTVLAPLVPAITWSTRYDRLPYMRRFLRAWQEADLADPVPGRPVPAGPDAPVRVSVDPGLRRWIHVPLTSYDALDTARALQFVRGHEVVRRLTDRVIGLFVERVNLFALQPQIGRTPSAGSTRPEPLPELFGVWPLDM